MATKKNKNSFQHAEIDSLCQIHWTKSMEQVDQMDQMNQLHQNQANDEQKSFNMILPPPNITGTLHLGHALNITIQDMISRYHRMMGHRVQWIPGVDHAGIATQVVVEKQLMKRSLRRHDLGREKFLEKVWEWKEQNNQRITQQLQTLCPLINYESEQFTMSPCLSQGVVNAFIELYDKGLIYRDLRMIDYCCDLKTVISKIEVEELEILEPIKYLTPKGIRVELGKMYDIAYQVVPDNNNNNLPLKDIIVSTTRPETLFGDIAVAVNPRDPRYHGMENVYLRVPLTQRVIPLIYCEQANMEMGTGAVKITPSHDPKDWETYKCYQKRYNLMDPINVIDDEGNMIYCENYQGPDLCAINGKDRFICRAIILKKLEESGSLVQTRNHKTTARICSRSKDILEPKLKYQWYLDTKDMCRRSIEAVESGALKIIPDPDQIHSETWKRYLADEQPWCISRQLWWGHRIPAYRVIWLNLDQDKNKETKEEWIIANSVENAVIKMNMKCKEYGLIFKKDYDLVQEEDVLDTWFSSGIYPFTILDKKYFPLDILETGKDILFFWVARMVMLSLCLTDTLPFKTVYLHNVIRGRDGKKMSKSTGNVIDPLDIIYGISKKDMVQRIIDSNLNDNEKKEAIANNNKFFPNGISAYGVDSLRLGLVYYLRQSTDIVMDPLIFGSAHSLLNKLWNCMLMYEHYVTMIKNRPNDTKTETKTLNESTGYSEMIQGIQGYIDSLRSQNLRYDFYESYDFSTIYDNINNYLMNNYCPFYLESLKFILTDENFHNTELEKQTIDHFLKSFLDILVYIHPIAPNVTQTMINRLTQTDVNIYEFSKLIWRNNNPVDKKIQDQINVIRAKIHEINSNKNSDPNTINTKTENLDTPYNDLVLFLTK